MQLGAADISQLAAALGTDDADSVAAVIDELAAIGFVRPSPLRPGAWKVLASDAALASSLRATANRLQQEVAFLSTVAQRATDLAVLQDHFAHREAPRDVEQVSGPEAILGQVARLTAAATSSVDSLLPHVPAESALLASIDDDGPVLERGVRIRSIFPWQAEAQAHVRRYAAQVGPLGVSLRTSALTPARVLVVDQAIAVVITSPLTEAANALILRQPALVDALSSLFLLLWDRATDLTPETPDAPLTPTEASIVGYMMIGLKDETIARALGVSSRTVRRVVGMLSTRAGVESRFALGVEAGRRGWLST